MRSQPCCPWRMPSPLGRDHSRSVPSHRVCFGSCQRRIAALRSHLQRSASQEGIPGMPSHHSLIDRCPHRTHCTIPDGCSSRLFQARKLWASWHQLHMQSPLGMQCIHSAKLRLSCCGSCPHRSLWVCLHLEDRRIQEYIHHTPSLHLPIGTYQHRITHSCFGLLLLR